jgi:glycosyltransferase involved in cell wall biosynthesis
VSKYTKNVLMKYYGVPEEKIKLVHNGIEPTEPVTKSKKGKDKVVIFLGRLAAQKGPEFFLETAEKVIDKVPNVRFAMAGTGDQLKNLIETRASKKIGTKFHFTGFLDEAKKRELFALADVYCMPSVSEPFGLSALEAAQQGIPCVISNQSGAAEVLTGALKTDYWDTDLTALQIIDLLDNANLRATVVEKMAKDLENLTWDKAAANISYAYRKMIP